MPRTLRAASLSAKLGTIGALLLLLALGSIGLTLWVTWQLEGGAAAVNEAGRLRMQTWRLAQTVGTGDLELVRAHARRFDDTVALLREGDPARPLFLPHDERTQDSFARLVQRWQATRGPWETGAQADLKATAAQAEALVADIEGFVAAIEAQLARWTTLLSMFNLGLMGLAIAGSVALLYAAYLFVFNPLTRLQEAVQRLQGGDLSARVDPETDAEFGRLAEAFNRMAATLQGFYLDLEGKVREKTESLSAERERLAVLYEASAFVNRTADLQTLAQGFVRRMRTAGKADAALLRWRDTERHQQILLASDCLPLEMLAQEQCLAEGTCHCGQPAQPLGARVIALQPVDADGTPRPCERFGFDHVLVVPVRLQDQHLAEIDLLYRGSLRTLSPEDHTLVETLAGHLASGMEGVRAAALQREAAVTEERALLARELHDSIAQALAFMKIQLQLLRTALRRGDAAQAAKVADELDAGVRESTADVRELLLHFRARAPGDDLVAALRTTLQKFQHQTGIATQLEVRGQGVPLPADQQVQLLFVVQEALSNVRKHAGARQVRVEVSPQPAWRVEVHDDGKGFDSRAPRDDDAHVGLRIMRERAQGIGARLEVQSVPGQGTTVVVALPAPQALAA